MTDTAPHPLVDEPADEADPATPTAALVALPDTGYDPIPAHREMEGLAAMAVTLASSRLVPDALHDKPADVFLVLLTARELHIAPTAALREAYVVNHKVTLSPKLRAAMVRQTGIGHLWKDPGNDHLSATWYGTRADEGHQVTHASTFTLDDARRAKDRGKPLADKDNWTSYPQRMLSWRALGYLLDDVFSEVGTGIYSPDELGAVTDEDGIPVIDVQTVEPLAGMPAPRGRKPATPPVGDQPIDPADLERLSITVHQLAALPNRNDDGHTAAEALTALWKQPRAEPIPPLAQLCKRHLKVAEAMVDSVLVRAKRGEWGELAADPDTGEVAPPAAQEAPAAPVPPSEGPEATPGPVVGVSGDAGEADEDVCTLCGEVVVPDVEDPPPGRQAVFTPDAELYHAECAPVDEDDTRDEVGATIGDRMAADDPGRPFTVGDEIARRAQDVVAEATDKHP